MTYPNRSYESYYKKAMEIRRLVLNDFKVVFRSKENPSGVDVLLTPTAPSSAGELKNALEKTKQNPVDLYLTDVMTIPANMAGKEIYFGSGQQLEFSEAQ